MILQHLVSDALEATKDSEFQIASNLKPCRETGQPYSPSIRTGLKTLFLVKSNRSFDADFIGYIASYIIG